MCTCRGAGPAGCARVAGEPSRPRDGTGFILARRSVHPMRFGALPRVPAAGSSPHEAPNRGSLHPALVLLGRASCSEPRGKGGVAAYVCAKVSASLWRGGADVRGRRGGAWLTPEVTPSLTSLRSAADGGGPVPGTGGGQGLSYTMANRGGPALPAASRQRAAERGEGGLLTLGSPPLFPCFASSSLPPSISSRGWAKILTPWE